MSSHIPRLWLPQMAADSKICTIGDAARVHHLRDVLRLKTGDKVFVFNDTAGEWLATVTNPQKNSLEVTLDECTRRPITMPRLSIYFAPLKRQATEWMVEKTTELGATDFFPIITAHTQVREINSERLRAIALDAVEQCGRLDVPVFHDSQKLHKLNIAAGLFAAIEGDAAIPRLTDAVQAHNKTTAILIGPEGGFSTDEAAWLKTQSNIVPVSLGKNILRAETAAILACGVLNLYANPS